MTHWRKWGFAGALFLAAALVFFSVGLSLWFPSKDVKRWLESLNVPGSLKVETVSLDPLLRLHIKGGRWFPDGSSYIASVVFPPVQIRPSWLGVLSGKKEIFFIMADGKKVRLSGFARSEDEGVHLSFQTEVPGRFPFPLKFTTGIKLEGMWRLDADLTVDPRKTRGSVSGTGRVRLSDLRIRVPLTSVGPLVLSFKKGSFAFSLGKSVLGLNKILFKGDDLGLEGEVTVWIDPFTHTPSAKGAFYLNPGVGLVTSNPQLDRIIRMLPRDARGRKLVF